MPDDFEEIARMLRQGAGREFQAEAEEDEELTEIQRRRHRDLADIARAAMHRGDRVIVTVGGLSLSHPIVAVGSDYLVMDTVETIIDVRLEAALLTVEPRPAGGLSSKPESDTFKARLAEHEQLGDVIELVTRAGRRVAGRIAVVARDHIAVIDDETGLKTFVPTAEVAVVVSRPPPRRR